MLKNNCVNMEIKKKKKTSKINELMNMQNYYRT